MTTASHTRPASASLLDEGLADFARRATSVTCASRDAHNMPAVVRGVACRLSEDRRRATVFLPGAQAAPLLDAVDQSGCIGVVLSEPSTHRTIQIKGQDARIAKPNAADFELIEDTIARFAAELAPMGYTSVMVRTLLSFDPATLAAVSFTIATAFDQTPGPQAGAPLQ